jgi:hypothetical protein
MAVTEVFLLKTGIYQATKMPTLFSLKLLILEHRVLVFGGTSPRKISNKTVKPQTRKEEET